MIRTVSMWVCCAAVTLVAVSPMAAPGVEDKASGAQAGTRDHKEKTGMALVLLRQGKLDEAELLLQEVLALTPDPERVYYELGLIHEQRGDSLKAMAAFKEGIKIHEQGRRQSP